MKPIDEMRKRVKRSALMNSIRDEMLAYIDAIEAEEIAERNVAYNEGYDAGFASADDWLAQHEDAMAEHGWVKLPLGAAECVRHHRPPTVEGILREFAEKMAENTAMYVAESWDADERDEADAAAVAEYAAKLRLRGEDE